MTRRYWFGFANDNAGNRWGYCTDASDRIPACAETLYEKRGNSDDYMAQAQSVALQAMAEGLEFICDPFRSEYLERAGLLASDTIRMRENGASYSEVDLAHVEAVLQERINDIEPLCRNLADSGVRAGLSLAIQVIERLRRGRRLIE